MNTSTEESLRLNKYLALQLGISRREADDLIEKGNVRINNAVATLGARFKTGNKVTVSGKIVEPTANYQYILFNKPAGYVCSRKAQGETPTIYSLLPKELYALKPVGRLDRDSSGLILLTNDGDFAYQMTHPKFKKTKIYQVEIDKELEPLHQQMISDFGVQLEDGRSQLILERLSDTDRTKWQVTMSEGRNRQIRRTFAALGYEVIKLHRTHFGLYSVGSLRSGAYEIVTKR